MKKLLEKEQFLRMLKRLAHEIIENDEDLEKIILVGIERKGTPIAKELQSLIKSFEGILVPVESINIMKHRDDDKKDDSIEIHFKNKIEGKICILVDDVLYTGRSVRAAMDALMDFGRPEKIQLAVLIDRGHRELPIRADFVGKNCPTSKLERVICDFEQKEVWISDNE